MKTARLLVCVGALASALLLGAANACAQTPTPILVADINTGNGPILGSDPGSYARLNATQTVFAAFDPVHGRELWITDGTPAGTSLLFDFCPGACSGNPNPLNAANAVARGVLYVAADDGARGAELWKVTSAGVVSFVKDINPGALGSTPSPMAFPGVSATSPGFFAATSAATGNELWKTDGTTAGTVLVKDLNPGPASSFPFGFGEGLNRVYFSATEPTSGRELYMSDGTPAGTVLRADIQSGPGSSSPGNFVEFINDTMIFTADDGIVGRELWITTPTSTTLLKDIAPGANASFPNQLIGFSGRIFFNADDSGSNRELWSSDGTPAGTVLFKDLCASCGSDPRRFATLNTGAGTRLLFYARTSATLAESLFVSDGSVAGTVAIFDPSEIAPQDFVISGSLAYFNTATDLKLFRTDGSAAGSLLVRDFANINFVDSGDFALGPTNANRILVAASDGFIGRELYVAGPNANATSLLKNIAPDLGYSNPQELTNLNGTLYFSAFSEATGRELWKVVDPAVGAVLVADIVPGATGSNPSQLTVFNGKLYFAINKPSISSQELYVSDGTLAGTHPLKDLGPGVILAYRNCLTVAGSRLYFNADGSDGRGFGPWISDGTDAGTVDVNPGGISNGFCAGQQQQQQGFANAGNEVLFAAHDSTRGLELFRSDGTAAGTALVRDIVPGAEDSLPRRFVSLGSRACFSVEQGGRFSLDDEEPWCSDGTAQGTLPLGDLNPGSESSQPRSLTRIGPWLVFSAFSPPMLDRRLWRSDGTSAGTVVLSPNVTLGQSLVGFPPPTFPGGGAPEPRPLEHDGNFVYFACFGGTSLCRQDVRPGNESILLSGGFPVGANAGGIDQLHVFPGGDALLSCAPAFSGRELCRFRAGPVTDDIAIVDIALGAASSSPEQITPVGDFIYFTADDGTHGRELWAVPLKDTIDRIFANGFD